METSFNKNGSAYKTRKTVQYSKSCVPVHAHACVAVAQGHVVMCLGVLHRDPCLVGPVQTARFIARASRIQTYMPAATMINAPVTVHMSGMVPQNRNPHKPAQTSPV